MFLSPQDVYNDFANLKKMVKQFSESIPNGCGNLTGREKHMSQVCRTYISSMEHRRRVLTMAVKYHSSADQVCPGLYSIGLTQGSSTFLAVEKAEAEGRGFFHS